MHASMSKTGHLSAYLPGVDMLALILGFQQTHQKRLGQFRSVPE